MTDDTLLSSGEEQRILVGKTVIVVDAHGNVTVNSDKKVEVVSSSNLQPGQEETPGGAIFAGISLMDGEDLFVTPTDCPLRVSFNDAAAWAQKLNTQNYLGHNDWRIGSYLDMVAVWQNRNKGKLSGTFKNATTFIRKPMEGCSSSFQLINTGESNHYWTSTWASRSISIVQQTVDFSQNDLWETPDMRLPEELHNFRPLCRTSKNKADLRLKKE